MLPQEKQEGGDGNGGGRVELKLQKYIPKEESLLQQRLNNPRAAGNHSI